MDSNDPLFEHGLRHSPDVLAALPPLEGCPNVKVLDANQFAAMHTAHIVAHPPDGVLFPFLHGLEGDNHAQNTFFAAPARRRPPRFRGLVWVVADEDLGGTPPFSADALSSEEEDDDEEYSDEEDELEEEEDVMLRMDVDGAEGPVRIVRGDEAMQDDPRDGEANQDDDVGKHMHPVAQRGGVTPLQTADLPLGTPGASSSLSGFTDEDYSPQTPDVPMQMCVYFMSAFLRVGVGYSAQ